MSAQTGTTRERWSSRTAFLFAAVGFAAGLGNVWRFPYQAYENGGGAFLIPYFFALLTAGIPLLILEYALGQRFQRGAPGAMREVGKGFELVGWWALIISLVIVTYYAAILAWILVFLWNSFSVAWAGNEESFFYDVLLRRSSGPGEWGGMSWPVVVGLLITWGVMYLILRRGLKGIATVVVWTVPLPIVMLVLLAIRGVTLPGAIEGLNFYLEPDFRLLLEPKTWLAAYSQIFFSLGIAFGLLIGYASFQREDADITNNAFITCFANCGISFLGGFAVFSVLGFMAQEQGVAVKDVAASSFGLAFIAYPKAIALLPFAQALFGFAFFVMLFTLGIDSAFPMIESATIGLCDRWPLDRAKVTGALCLFGLLVGLAFASGPGYYHLDVIDYFANNYGLVLIGLMQCLAVGWFFGTGKLREYCNEVSEIRLGAWWDACVKFVTPGILLVMLALRLKDELTRPYGNYPAWALSIGVAMAVAAPVVGWLLARRKREAAG